MPSAEWKLRVLKAPWYAGETVSVAIGQGQVSATPIQMARVAAFVANGGRLVRPHFARQARTPQLPPIVKPETIAAVKEGMRRVVAEGTGSRARLERGRGLRQDRLGAGGRPRAAREVALGPRDAAARLVHLLRPRRPSDDRARGAGRARQERRRVGGAGGAARSWRTTSASSAAFRHRPAASSTQRTRRTENAGAQRRHRPSAGLQPRLGAARHVAAAVAAGRRDGVLGDPGRQPARALPEAAHARRRGPRRDGARRRDRLSPAGRSRACCSTCCRCWRSSTCCASPR